MDPNYYTSVDGWFDWMDIYDLVVGEAPDGATLVELGVSLGKSLIYLASRVKLAGKTGIKIFGVDCWDIPLRIQGDVVVQAAPSEESHITYHPADSYGRFLANLKAAEVDDIVTPLKMMTVDAANLFADCSCFMVFFDASHAYAPVLADLKAWHPKVMIGGIEAGHDYNGGDETPGPSTGGLGPWLVPLAVHEMFGRHGVAASGNSWWRRNN